MADRLPIAEWKALSSQRKEELVCSLSCFPALRRKEIAAWLGIRIENLDMVTSRGRKRGLKTFRDIFPDSLPTDDHEPSRDELLWRLEHQSPDLILARFGELTAHYFTLHGLSDRLPAGIPVAPSMPVTPDSPPAGDAILPLPGGNISVQVYNQDEATLVDQLVAAYQDQFALRPTHWVHIQPIIEQRLMVLRMRRAGTTDDLRDPQWGAKLTGLENRIADSAAKLRAILPDRSQADAGDLFQQAIDNCLDLLDQRGYRTTLACPRCGELLAAYLVLYRTIVECSALAKEVLEARFLTAFRIDQFKDAARAILDLQISHPLLNQELRDLGTAWTREPVAILFSALGQPVTRDLIQRVAAAILEVSTVAIDDTFAFSPINRLDLSETGQVRVVTPE